MPCLKNMKLHTLCIEYCDSLDAWRYLLEDIERCRRLSDLRVFLSHSSIIFFLDQFGLHWNKLDQNRIKHESFVAKNPWFNFFLFEAFFSDS